VSRIFLERVKSTSFLFVEVLGSHTEIPKGLEKNRNFWRGGGVNNFGIQRAWGGGG